MQRPGPESNVSAVGFRLSANSSRLAGIKQDIRAIPPQNTQTSLMAAPPVGGMEGSRIQRRDAALGMRCAE